MGFDSLRLAYYVMLGLNLYNLYFICYIGLCELDSLFVIWPKTCEFGLIVWAIGDMYTSISVWVWYTIVNLMRLPEHTSLFPQNPLTLSPSLSFLYSFFFPSLLDTKTKELHFRPLFSDLRTSPKRRKLIISSTSLTSTDWNSDRTPFESPFFKKIVILQ